MNGINTYRDLDLDTSIILNFPKGMPKVVPEVIALLNAKGAIVVEDGPTTVQMAKDLVANATGDTTTYHLITTDNPTVWNILKESVNRDDLRVIGVFHGAIPSTVPENVFTIDIGRSLNRKVSRHIVTNISDAVKNKGTYPQGKPEELFIGVRSLCYEVLYNPEYRVYPKDVARRIPVGLAFDFMYNPPQPLDDLTRRSAVTSFMDKIHGHLG